NMRLVRCPDVGLEKPLVQAIAVAQTTERVFGRRLPEIRQRVVLSMSLDWRRRILADAAQSRWMCRATTFDARVLGAEFGVAFFTGVAVVWIHCGRDRLGRSNGRSTG